MEEGDDVHLDGEWLHSPTQKKKHPASVTDLGRTQSEKKQKTAGDTMPAVSNVPPSSSKAMNTVAQMVEQTSKKRKPGAHDASAAPPAAPLPQQAGLAFFWGRKFGDVRPVPFTCDAEGCTVASRDFMTQKALSAHKREKHGGSLTSEENLAAMRLLLENVLRLAVVAHPMVAEVPVFMVQDVTAVSAAGEGIIASIKKKKQRVPRSDIRIHYRRRFLR